MKKLFMFILAAVSFQSMATTLDYTGYDQGSACSVQIDLTSDEMRINEYSVVATKKSIDGRTLTLEGATQFSDIRMIYVYSADGSQFESAIVQTKTELFPNYATQVECKDLVRVK